MTAFVVLAAGRGSRLGRIGDALPKCLLPINGRAVLSHQFALVPSDHRLIVVTGYRDQQVREYVQLAHPGLDVTFVHDDEWGTGPGASLLTARDAVGDDDLVFVAADTLWTHDQRLWSDPGSWVATAPVPAGTPAARWCRVNVGGDPDFEYVVGIDDKTPDVRPNSRCWTAFAKIARDDLRRFWAGLTDAPTRAGEVQLSSGLEAIVNGGEPVTVHEIEWLDVGDERAFRAAVATLGGYDALKPDQVTYVIPSTERVVKFHVDRDKVRWRAERAKLLGDAVPQPIHETWNGTMVGYDYVQGTSVYSAMQYRPNNYVAPVLDWWLEKFWTTRLRLSERPPNFYEASDQFYRDKTFARVESLDPALQSIALDVITRLDWEHLTEGVVPGTFHGDFTFANVLTWDDDWNQRFTSVDWREDYAGVVDWGDLRYDLGKLLAGARFHWERASYGDFRRWDSGPIVEQLIEDWIAANVDVDFTDVQRIAALCLINSSALHAAPMDEILIARGCHWLETLT